jgi:hypothetical protein
MSATSNSTASFNANVDNFAIEFLASLPESNAGSDVDFLREGGHADETNTTPSPSRVPFNVGLPSGPDDGDDGPERVDAPRGSVFPSTIPMVQNRFFNQNSESNDDGYDSEGGLQQVDDAVEFLEEPLEDTVEGPPPAAQATEQLTIETMMALKMKELKEELRKRGRSIFGKKGELQERLKEAILLNVPVATGNEARRHESMSGLDVTARWVLLTPEDAPIPEPQNADQSLHPPTEMNGTLNPKFGMKETFLRGAFTGTNETIRYTASLVSPPAVWPPKKRARRVRKLLPTRQLYANTPIEPRVVGGPQLFFLYH